MNRRLNTRQKVIAALIILTLLWTGNIFYYFNHQLSHPLLMNHRYEVYLDDAWQNYFLRLHYLVNRIPDKEIVQIEFLGSGLQLTPTNTVSNTFTHQVLKQMHIELTQDDIKSLLNAGDEYQQAEVLFNDGERRVLDLGVIRFYKANASTQVIYEQSSGSSNNNSGYRIFKAQEPVEITGLDYSFKELLADELIIVVDTTQSSLTEALNANDPGERHLSHDYLFSFSGSSLNSIEFPISLDRGDLLKVTYQFRLSDTQVHNQQNPLDQRPRGTYYRLSGKIAYRTQDQEQHLKEFIMDYTPYFTEQDIRRIVAARRGE